MGGPAVQARHMTVYSHLGFKRLHFTAASATGATTRLIKNKNKVTSPYRVQFESWNIIKEKLVESHSLSMHFHKGDTRGRRSKITHYCHQVKFGHLRKMGVSLQSKVGPEVPEVNKIYKWWTRKTDVSLY